MIKVMAMIAAAGLATAPVMAQHAHEQRHERAHERAHAAAGEARNASGGDYESVDVVTKNGEACVWIDGEELDEGDIKRGDHGEVMFRWDGEWRTTGASSAPAPPQARRVMLGVVLGEVDEALAAQLGIDADGAVLIQRVVEGSAADRAGIKRFDILTGFADEEALSADRLRALLSQQSPGDEAQVVVLRGGEKKRLTVKFDEASEAPNEPRMWAPQAPTPPAPPRVRFFPGELDEQTRAKIQEAMRQAERHAQQAQETAKRLTIELQGKLAPLQEIELRGLEMDEDVRRKLEEAMTGLQKTLREQDFDVEFDFNFEDLPRMKFIELDEEKTARLREGRRFPEARERAVILEGRERDAARRMEGLQRRIERGESQRLEAEERREGTSAQIERLEERMERLERLLERALERMERRERESRPGA